MVGNKVRPLGIYVTRVSCLPGAKLRQASASLSGHSLGMDYAVWPLGTRAMLGQLECRPDIACAMLRALTGHGGCHAMGMIVLLCMLDVEDVTSGRLMCNHLACGLSMGSWHVV